MEAMRICEQIAESMLSQSKDKTDAEAKTEIIKEQLFAIALQLGGKNTMASKMQPQVPHHLQTWHKAKKTNLIQMMFETAGGNPQNCKAIKPEQAESLKAFIEHLKAIPSESADAASQKAEENEKQNEKEKKRLQQKPNKKQKLDTNERKPASTSTTSHQPEQRFSNSKTQ